MNLRRVAVLWLATGACAIAATPATTPVKHLSMQLVKPHYEQSFVGPPPIEHPAFNDLAIIRPVFQKSETLQPYPEDTHPLKPGFSLLPMESWYKNIYIPDEREYATHVNRDRRSRFQDMANRETTYRIGPQPPVYHPTFDKYFPFKNARTKWPQPEWD